MDLAAAEDAMRQQCREMSRELFQFLGKAGELPEADSMSASFMKGHPPARKVDKI